MPNYSVDLVLSGYDFSSSVTVVFFSNEHDLLCDLYTRYNVPGPRYTPPFFKQREATL